MIGRRKTWADVKHFRVKEFDSPDAVGSGIHMDIEFVLKLDALREQLGFPLVVNSGYRTTQHNASVAKVEKSAHVLGWAADVRALNSTTRFRIVQAALLLGFKRVGIGSAFVHLDDDPTKPMNVLWVYP